MKRSTVLILAGAMTVFLGACGDNSTPAKDAQDKVSAAQEKAQDAKGIAQDAQEKAQDAKDSAQDAQEKAQDAKDSAQDAKDTVEDADANKSLESAPPEM